MVIHTDSIFLDLVNPVQQLNLQGVKRHLRHKLLNYQLCFVEMINQSEMKS